MKEHHHDEGPHLALADALAFLRQGKKKEALSSLQNLLTRAELPEARFLLAKILLEDKKSAAAISHLEGACNCQTPFVHAHLLLAQQQEEEHSATPTLHALCDTLTLIREQVDLLAKELANDPQKLAEVFKDHINNELPFWQSLQQKSMDILNGLEKQDEAKGLSAEASFTDFVKAAESTYKGLNKVYAVLEEMVAKEPKTAMPILRETLSLVSQLEDIHEKTAVLFLKAEKSDQAFPHFLRALCNDPHSTRAHLGLARASAYSWHHHLAAHLSLQTLQEDSFNMPKAQLHGLTTLSHLPGDKKAFSLCGKLQDKAKDPDVRFLARKVYHQWRDHFEKHEQAQRDESPQIDLEESKKIISSGETQEKLLLSFQILKTKDPRALPLLLSSIESEKDPFVLSAYAKALGAVGDGSDEVWSTMQKLMKHQDSRVRANTIEALDKVEDDLVWPILVPMLQDSDNRVKANTIRSLLKRNVEGAQDLVAKLAYSSKQSRRESALFCMSKANAPWCSPILQNMLDKESIDELVQEECRQLALVGQKECISLLAVLSDQASAWRQMHLEKTLSTLCNRFSVSDEECEELKLAHLSNVRPQAAEAVADLSVSRWEVEVEPEEGSDESPLLPLWLAAISVLVLLVFLGFLLKSTAQP